MAREPVISKLTKVGAVVLGMLVAPTTAAADGRGTTVYNNYGDAVYYTTNNNLSYTTANVNYAPSTAYVPANYPANFACPQPAPAAYGVAYREPGYAQPACAQPVYTYPVCRQPTYVVPRARAGVGVGVWIGGSWGHSKAYRHRAVHHRKVHRVRKAGHRTIRASHNPRVNVGFSRGHYSPRGHHQPRHVQRHSHPQRSGQQRGHHRSGPSFGRRHRH